MSYYGSGQWGSSYGSYGPTGELFQAFWSFLTSVTGISVFSTMVGGGQADATSAKVFPMLILGALVEIGRRLCVWAFERFRPQLYINAQFNEGDPAYDWIIHMLTSENVWKRSKDFRVTSKTSKRKWSVGLSEGGDGEDEHAEYVPTYNASQLWRWKGYLIEVSRSVKDTSYIPDLYGRTNQGTHTIYLSMYTLNMGALSALVEEARKRYYEVSRPFIMVHSMDSLQPSYMPSASWGDVKKKARRPLESIILPDGVIESILDDAREFVDMADWYLDAGIPHRRGYLLYGPPGTGKSSTIYALAGELGMEIYALSLSSRFIDDTSLKRAADSIPKNSIFLIEDIDCAFPPRDEDDDTFRGPMMRNAGYVSPDDLPVGSTHSNVTLSGLLNVLDGVGSEEGKLFFATTNHVDQLDPALIRPGRIDMKVEYTLASRKQAAALFQRFYPAKHIKEETIYPRTSGVESDSRSEKRPSIEERIMELSEIFADRVPEDEFSTAELQGYLLIYKREPYAASEDVVAWVEKERAVREEKKKRDEERKEKRAKAMKNGMWPTPLIIGPGGQQGMVVSTVQPPSANQSANTGEASTEGVVPGAPPSPPVTVIKGEEPSLAGL